MSNILDFGCSAKAPSKVGGGGQNVIKYFPRPITGAAPWSVTNPTLSNLPAVSTPSVSNLSAPQTLPSANNPTGSLWVPNTSFDGQQFNVLVSGTYGFDTNDPSGTVTIQLRAVTGTLSAPTYTVIASTGSMVPFVITPVPWAFDVTLLGDSVSGLLTGYYSALGSGGSGAVGLVNSTPKTIDNIISGLDFQKGNPALQQGAVFGLVVSVTFGTGDPSNTASMTQFAIES